MAKAEREFTGKEWFIGMMVAGILLGGLGIMFNSQSELPDVEKLPNWMAFLMGFLPMLLFGLLMWIAAKRTGHKGIPIK